MKKKSIIAKTSAALLIAVLTMSGCTGSGAAGGGAKTGTSGSSGQTKDPGSATSVSAEADTPDENAKLTVEEVCDLYASALEKIHEENKESIWSESGFGLIYLDDDDLPELVWTIGGSHPNEVRILTCGDIDDEKDNSVVPGVFEVAGAGQFGSLLYSRKTGIFINNYSGMGTDIRTYMSMNGTEEAYAVQSLETYMEPLDEPDEDGNDYFLKYYVDEKEVDETVYDEAVKKWKNYILINIGFGEMSRFGDDVDYSAELMKWINGEMPSVEPIDHDHEAEGGEQSGYDGDFIERIPEAYRWILGGVYWNLIDDPSGIVNVPGDATGVLEVAIHSDHPSDQIGVAILDIDDNGYEEMLMIDREAEAPYNGSQILALYTLTGDETGDWQLVTTGGARIRYFLMEDNTIMHTGSASVSEMCFGIYALEKGGTELVCKEFYFSDEGAGGEEEWFRNDTGEWDKASSVKTDLTRQQLDMIMEQSAAKTVMPENFTFREYMDAHTTGQ